MNLAPFIDHTKLTFGANEQEPEQQDEAIATLCQEAMMHGFCAVCVRPQHVALAQRLLKNSSVRIATVIGFPQEKVTLADEMKSATIGDIPSEEKIEEAKKATIDGAQELDIVFPVARFKVAYASNDPQTALQEISTELEGLRATAPGLLLKVILETDLLTTAELHQAALICVRAGMNMLKTSTGMVDGGKGATIEIIHELAKAIAQPEALEGQTTGEKVGIKASGGIKNAEQAVALLKAGATRLGTSSGVAIVSGQPVSTNAY